MPECHNCKNEFPIREVILTMVSDKNSELPQEEKSAFLCAGCLVEIFAGADEISIEKVSTP